VTRVGSPRQPRRRLRHVGHAGLRRRSGERRRLRRPVENDGRIGGRFHDQRRAPGRLSRLTGSLARVPAGVRLTKIYQQTTFISALTAKSKLTLKSNVKFTAFNDYSLMAR